MARTTTALEPLLREAGNGVEADFIWQLDAGDAVFDKARQLLQDAETSILVSLWPEELRTLAEDLRDAESRGVRIALVH